MLKASHSPTAANSPEDAAVVRETQAFFMGATKGTHVARVVLKDRPNCVYYLHSLVNQGLADSYNFYDNKFVVKIQVADRWRFSEFKDVECVMLQYKGAA